MYPRVPLLYSQEPATCPYPEPNQSRQRPSFNFLKIHFSISLPCMLNSSKYFPAFMVTSKTPYAPVICPVRATRPAHPILFLSHHTHDIWRRVQVMKFLITQLPPVPCSTVPPSPKYLPQHPVLRYPQPVFLLQCGRPSFTPIQNNSQN